ncbi:MAG: hypothetical protein AB7V16_07275 [Vulcanibacillus sp.]
MKVTATCKDKVENPKFPCLMICKGDGHIILFTSDNIGTTILPPKNSSSYIGEYITSWSMEFFEPFEGEVILSNT